MKSIFYKVPEEQQDFYNSLERSYYEMTSLQALLINIINNNPKLIVNQEYYVQKYIEAYSFFVKQKKIFQTKVLQPVFDNNFNWEIDFYNQIVKVEKTNE